jgi:hypothetical protein
VLLPKGILKFERWRTTITVTVERESPLRLLWMKILEA